MVSLLARWTGPPSGDLSADATDGLSAAAVNAKQAHNIARLAASFMSVSWPSGEFI
jgi:hypothetical protein